MDYVINLDSDEDTPKGTSVVEQLKSEILNLKSVVESQAQTLMSMGKTMIKKESVTPCSPPSPLKLTTVTKPRDIPMLELHHLEGLEASSRLQMFLELVEQTTEHEHTRVQVAKSRLSPELAMLIHNEQSKAHCITWDQLCQFLHTEFAVDLNLDRAWQELDAMQYDCEESPQTFTNRFICQYAVLENRFPFERFPARDKTIKRKIWHGLPKELREKVEGFLDEDYPLNKYLDRVEYQRHLWLENHLPPVHQVKEKQSPKRGQEPPSTPSLPQVVDVNQLQQQIKELTENIQQIQMTPPRLLPQQYQSPRRPPHPPPLFPNPPHYRESVPQPQSQGRSAPYCAYCRTNSHSLRECTKAPKRGHCFDCLRPGRRRGSAQCPGRVNHNL